MTSRSKTSPDDVDDSSAVFVLKGTNFDCAKAFFSLKHQDSMESDFEDDHSSGDASQRIEQITSYDSVIESIINEVRLTTLSTPLELDLLSTCDANADTSNSTLHSVNDSFVHQKISTPKQHFECAAISDETAYVTTSTAEQKIQQNSNDVNSAINLNTDVKLSTDNVSNLDNSKDEICDQHKINEGNCDTDREESILKISSNSELNDTSKHTSNIQVPVLLTEEEIRAITIESRSDKVLSASTMNSSSNYSNEKACNEKSPQEKVHALSEFMCDEKINYETESAPSSSSALSTMDTVETIKSGELNVDEIKLTAPIKSKEIKQPDCLNSTEKYDEYSSLNEATSEITTTLHFPSDLKEECLESLKFTDDHFSLSRECTESNVAGSTDATASTVLSTLSIDLPQKTGIENSSSQPLSTEQKSMKSRFKDFWRIKHKENLIGNENFFIKRLHNASE